MVCDVNSEKKVIASQIFELGGNFYFVAPIIPFLKQKLFVPKGKTREKTVKMHKSAFADNANSFLLPLCEPMLPLCAILSHKSR